MKLMVTGAGGMLGHDVVSVARGVRHQVVALAREDLDVTNPARVERAVLKERPGAIINCAAWTDVDGAEENEAQASQVNGEGAGFVAAAAAQIEAKVLQVSTDYVFDGAKVGAYLESDETGPIQAYGRSKLAGERAVALANQRSFIVRSSWLFGPHGDNFVATMLRLGSKDAPVMVVHDQVGSPTYTGHLAIGLVRLIDSSAYGIHHMAGAGSCSWYEFAQEIFRRAGVDARTMGATSEMLDRRARRPANSVLESGREAPIRLPEWQRGLADYLERMEARERKTAEDKHPAGEHAIDGQGE
jgi:dTDP-4-dehydrorhamnose reductase